MVRGRTKPSRVACGIGVACNCVMVISLLSSHNTSGLVLPAIFLLCGLLTLVLSLKYGVSGFSRTDIIASVVSIIAIVSWLVLGANAAVIGVNTAQITALIATFNKLRKNPGTEDLVSWGMGGTASLLSLFAILLGTAPGTSLSIAAIALPVRCVLSCAVILALALFQHHSAQTAQAAPRIAVHHHSPLAWLQVAGRHGLHAFGRGHHDFDLVA